MVAILALVSRRGLRKLHYSRFRAPWPFVWRKSGWRKSGSYYDERWEWPTGSKQGDRKHAELLPRWISRKHPHDPRDDPDLMFDRYDGCQAPGYDDAKTGEFVRVAEMQVELVVPDLTDFNLKPYVSIKTDVEIDKLKSDDAWPLQEPITAEYLFEQIYADEIRRRFKSGAYNKQETTLSTGVARLLKVLRGRQTLRWPSKLTRMSKLLFAGKDTRVTTVVATPGYGADRQVEVQYTETKVIGNGSFGVVYSAKLVDSADMVAIKKVLQDKRFKNRELQIMRKLEHQNIVRLKYFFYSAGDKKDELYLNLILEFIPETVYRVARHYSKNRQTIPVIYIKLYMYQLFRALIHALGVCHRDIKPQNLLLDPDSALLKLCDFGSAKHLVRGEPNVSYICSRYYRAPELIFGATDYTTNIDVWSAGCVLAELLLGQPIFPGDSGVDQLVEIIKVLGTPTRDQIQQMNPNYTEFKFPQIKAHPWQRVFRPRTPPEAIDLVSRLLEYTPNTRLSPLQACAHAFFHELRTAACRLPNGRDLPPLFNFTEQGASLAAELRIQPSLNATLVPAHAADAAAALSPSDPLDSAAATDADKRV